MKESVLDVLMYLFESYADEDTDIESDREQLQHHLSEIGFPDNEIDKAFNWLENLANQEAEFDSFDRGLAVRIYSNKEMDRLDVQARGFLLFLEQNRVLSPVMRELVIDRVMDLETDDFSLDELKWVVLMVLFNQPGQEDAYSWLESIMFEGPPEYLH